MAEVSRVRKSWLSSRATLLFVGIPVLAIVVLKVVGVPDWVIILLLLATPFVVVPLLFRGMRRNSMGAVAAFAQEHGWELQLGRGVLAAFGADVDGLPADPDVLPRGATRKPFDGEKLDTGRFLLKQYGEHQVQCYTVVPSARVAPGPFQPAHQIGADGKVQEAVRDAGVVQVRLPGGPYPWTMVSLQALPEEADAVFGGQDIAFESEAFNRRFRVRGDDRRFSHDLVSPRVMEYLLDTPWPKPVTRWSVDGDALLWWRDGVVPVEDLPAIADFLVGLRRLVPAHLLEA